MVDKRSIQKDVKRLRRVKTWQLMILLILAAFLAAHTTWAAPMGLQQAFPWMIACGKN